MSRLFLHIGSHKTGTTSIQKACRLHPPKEANHVTYLDIRPSGTRILYSEGKLANFRCQVDMQAADTIFRPAPKRPDETYVTSDEEFFWISNPEDIRSFARMLKERFQDITIICYLRRQDMLAVSHRKQVSEGTPATRFYGVHTMPLPLYKPHYQKYFDYDAKLMNVWAAAFGKDNIQLIPYTRSELVHRDVVGDFAHRIGAQFTSLGTIRTNQSMSGIRTLVGLKLIELGIRPKRRKSILQRLPERGEFLPTQQEAQVFLAHFADANERLASRWSWKDKPFRFESSFDMYPETKASTWTDENITDILNAVLAKKSHAP